MSSLHWTALALCLASSRASAQAKPQTFPTLGLTVTFPASFADVAPVRERAADGLLGGWTAALGAKHVTAWLMQPDYAVSEPSELTTNFLRNRREGADHGEPSFQFDECRVIHGPFGWAPYASYARWVTRAPGSTSPIGGEFYFCGVTKEHAYILDLEIAPAPDASDVAAVLEFLTKGVVYSGPVRDGKWSDDEALARWKEHVPKSDLKARQAKILRTAHYLILTNSSGGVAFAKKMEEFYATIQSTYPFEEIADRRLMPVFLFQMAQEYYEFFAKEFETSEDEARKSKGIASDDFYATWYEAPNDPVHIHEATHQIFGNRLMLDGGGSWFQEGVAEYVCTRHNDRNEIARLVKNHKHVPLAKFMAVESLLFSSGPADKSGDDPAHTNYAQAALLIEFLRDGKLCAEKFSPWMHAIGLAPYGDTAAIERITREHYGLDIAGLDQALVEYCKKR